MVFAQIEEQKRRQSMREINKEIGFTSSQLRENSIENRETMNAYKDKLYRLMKVAYLHPTVRELISNPNMIYYDSYG